MKNTPLIRRVLAGVLLVVFALGITPKRTLHNLIANHKDATAKTAAPAPGEQLSRSGFNCQLDNLVCESPFTPEVFSFTISGSEIFPAYRSLFISAGFTSRHFSFGLRGPPVV